MEIRRFIDEAKGVYTAAGLSCADGLLAPASDAEISAMASALSLTIPPELWQVYRVHGGQEYVPPGITGLFGEHRLYRPAEAIAQHRMLAENCFFEPRPVFPPPDDEWGYWVPELIPFASWDAYDLCIHSATGEVWEFIPSTGLIRHRPSIVAVLREIIANVRVGRDAKLGAMRCSA